MLLKTINKIAASLVLCIIVMFVGYVLAHVMIPDTAPALSPIPFKPQKKTIIAPYMHGADAKRGQFLFTTHCARCHSIGSNISLVGPNLQNITGRSIASSDSFPYSQSLKEKHQLIWNDQNLSDWIDDPFHFAPGTRMSFGGIDIPQQRADIIIFLKKHSNNSKDVQN